MGHAYNAAVWEECRRNGVMFLQQVKKRLPGIADQALDSAIKAYGEVSTQLKSVTELYPFFENNREEPLGDNPKSQKTAEFLEAASQAEATGLKHLQDVLEALS